MLLKLLLGLRDGRQRVEVVRLNGRSRPELGRTHPQDEDRRAAILKHWSIAAESPRKDSPATIDEALPKRAQTILSYRVAPELRQRLDSGMGPLAASRKDQLAGKREEAAVSPRDDEE